MSATVVFDVAVAHEPLAKRFGAGDISRQPLTPQLETMLLSGALDPDMNVRESALQGLRRHRHPALPALAAAQLDDPDPEIRLLGLDHLKDSPPEVGVAVVSPLLGDSDLQRTPPATTLDSSAPWPDISTPGSMTE